jgi:putative aldouronate transport system permease protein
MLQKRGKLGMIQKDIKQNWASYILLLPAALYTFIFGYATLPYLIIVFQKYNVTEGLFNGEWIGFRNFEAFFSSPRWLEVTRNTITINFFSIIFTTILAVLISILLNEIKNKVFVRTTQSTFLFPHFLSWVVVSYMIYALFASDVGLVNQVLVSLGLEKVNWYSTPKPWTWILVWMRVWKGLGFNIVIFLSAIAGIDSSIYEAAIIDGSSRMQRIRFITVPLLFPAISIVLLFAIGKIFYGDFGMIYSIIRDNAILFPKTDVIDTYVFRLLRKTGDPAHSMAVGLYQSLLGFIMVFGTNIIARKLDEDSALF